MNVLSYAAQQGFYYLLFTRLTSARFCPYPKTPLARVGFVTRVFKSHLRVWPYVLVFCPVVVNGCFVFACWAAVIVY